MDLPLDLRKPLIVALTELKSKFFMVNNVTKSLELRGEVEGTVFSGHPTRTTWGNTLRVLSYIEYVCRDNKYSYQPFVSGDDATLMIERADLDIVL